MILTLNFISSADDFTRLVAFIWSIVPGDKSLKTNHVFMTPLGKTMVMELVDGQDMLLSTYQHPTYFSPAK